MTFPTRAVKVRADYGHPPAPEFMGPGAFRMPFGRHAGRMLSQLPENYILWLADECKSPSVRAAAKAFLGLDGCGPDADPDTFQEGEPDRESAAVRLPLVVFEHEMLMAGRFGTDPTTPEGRVVLASRSVLRGLCSKTTGRRWPEESEGGA